MRPGRIAHRSCAAMQNPGTKYSPPPSPLHHPLIPLTINTPPLGKALAICTRSHIPTQGDMHPSLDESTSTRAQCLWHRPGARARYGPLVRALGARRMEADPVDSRRHSPVGTLHPVHVMINSDLHPTLSDAKPLFFLLVPPPPSPRVALLRGDGCFGCIKRLILTVVSQAHAVHNARRGRHRNGPPSLC